ncbi:hypothetical protein BLNAU_11107 [Blattamonas nauphoetae]|uniref:Uncharacterized protein n=1 Tax=Blattamonas nauphoetae TaxID=2049346 RepID=A0ABQ9XR05_9EUKA|nr:hypothetical protein BLNAU_11107 [Blattamonas nauphoetae]
MDTSPFLNWNEEQFKTVDEQAVVFRSLVATVKFPPELDDSLEAKAVKFLESVAIRNRESADSFINSLASNSHKSSIDLVESIAVLLSTHSQDITTAAVEMIKSLIINCSPIIRLALVKADLLTQIVINLNPLSLSFTETVNIHIDLIVIIEYSVWLAAPDGLNQLGIEDIDEQQAVHETILKQVLTPSEKYIYGFCVNRHSIVHNGLSMNIMDLLTKLLQISPYYQPTMDFVLHMPIYFTLSRRLTFFEKDSPFYWFPLRMIRSHQEWNKKRGAQRQMWKTVLRMLRTESFEDLLERTLQYDQNECRGRWIVEYSINWNNLQGMNLQGLPSRTAPLWKAIPSTDDDDLEGSEDVVAESMAVLDPSSVTTFRPTPLCLSPHHPHPLTPLCLSLTTHTLPLPSASTSPQFVDDTLSHSPLLTHPHTASARSLHSISLIPTSHSSIPALRSIPTNSSLSFPSFLSPPSPHLSHSPTSHTLASSSFPTDPTSSSLHTPSTTPSQHSSSTPLSLSPPFSAAHAASSLPLAATQGTYPPQNQRSPQATQMTSDQHGSARPALPALPRTARTEETPTILQMSHSTPRSSI